MVLIVPLIFELFFDWWNLMKKKIWNRCRKNGMNEEIRNKFICWSAEMDIRYDKIFSIIDIKEENMKKRGEVLPFYKNVQKEGGILWKAA